MNTPTSRRKALAAAAISSTAIAAALATLPALTASAAPAAPSRDRYIVMTTSDPLATYTGGVGNFDRTRPGKGKGKVDTTSANARGYARHLEAEHDDALASAGIATSAITEDYTVAFNGFTAELTAAQAATLAKQSEVAQVWADEIRYGDTVSTPKFLGMTGSDGVWQKQFGGADNAGNGVIVGVIDSGIWPENPSFAAWSSPRPDQAVIDAKWHGVCDSGTEEKVVCNNKLIGARYYAQGNNVPDFEFNSPRDYNGHGSHTASTAAGHTGVTASINGGVVGDISGMAPGARIAAYKVLWQTPDGRASGSTSGIVAAIDDAVADGVDVINYSVSGSDKYIVTPDEIGFFNAAAANVFVSASAGNSGDTIGVSSVAHNAPWEMTVAASTHDRGATNGVTLGDGTSQRGVGVSADGVGPAPLVESAAVAAAGADPTAARLCLSEATNGSPALDPAKVEGTIVICQRGSNARVDKSAAVAEAGGVGMILVNNTDAESLNADFHTVPTSHVNATAGTAIRAYASTATSPTATITPRSDAPARAPEMAGFSSYGPALAGNGDLLKPDITGPGVDVIAAVAPPGQGGNDFNAMSGTSMSAPHLAGLAALVRQAHPNWSPMWVKSALMTTASTLDNTGKPIQRAGHNATPLDYGNGHVVPGKAFNPGVVYDNGPADWARYGCAIDQFQLITAPTFCEQQAAMDPSDLNYPSIAVNDLSASQTVTRTLTNTSPDQASVYTPTVQAPPGFTAKVNVSKLSIPPLASRTFKVTFTRTTAPLGEWAFGSLTWKDKRGHAARSSVALRPVALTVPEEISGTGTTGSQTLSVTTGYTGTLTTKVDGLVPAKVDTTPTPQDTNSVVTVTVPAGTKVARFATYDADYPANTDVDLVVHKGTTEVGSSAGATAEESVTLEGDDLGGTYTVEIDYFAGAGTSLDVALNSFLVGGTDAGNLTVDPATQPVTARTPVDVTLNWAGLEAGTRYLGTVHWGDGTTWHDRSLITIK